MADLVAVLSADSSQLQKAMNDAKNVLNRYKDTVNNTIGVTQEQTNAFANTVTSINKLINSGKSAKQMQKGLQTQIENLAVQYNSLSDEIRQSDFGKAMADSINQANQRLQEITSTINQCRGEAEQMNDTGNENRSVFNDLIDMYGGTITKLGALASVVGVAKGAISVYSEAIKHNQETSDKAEGYQEALNTSINNFYYALGSGDFSYFTNGLNNIISRAIQAQNAVDQLGNTLMSYGIVSAKAQNKIAKARVVLYDPKATKEQKEQAKKDMKAANDELKRASAQAVADYTDTLRKRVAADSNIDVGNISQLQIDKFLELDAKDGRKKAREQIEKRYKQFQKEQKQIQKKYTKTKTFGFGEGQTTETVKIDGYDQAMSKLNNTYRDAIVGHTLLTKYTDAELKQLGDLRIAQLNLDTQMQTSMATSERVENKINNTTNATKGLTKASKELSKVKFAVGSLDDLEEQLNKARKRLSSGLFNKGETEDSLKNLIEQLQKAINNKKIQLGIELDPDKEKLKKDADNLSKEIEKTINKNNTIEYKPEVSEVEHYTSTPKSNEELFNDNNNQIRKNNNSLKELSDEIITVQSQVEKLKDLFSRQGNTFTEEQKEQLNQLNSILDSDLQKKQKLTEENYRLSKSNQELNESFKKISIYDGVKEGYNGLKSMKDATFGVADGFRNMAESWDEMNDWEKLETLTDSIFNSIDAIVQFCEGIQAICNMFNMFKAASTAAQAVDNANTQQKIANNTAKVASDTGSAIAGATNAGASLPFPANLAAIAAGVAAVIAAISMIGSFADGGIIGGATTLGDYNIARVNKGEMILNGSHQARLFNLLNGNGGYGSNNTVSGNVQFKIRGSELVGVLNNYNQKRMKI